MSDTTAAIDQGELTADSRLDDMLERVSFQPGIMLGSEALLAEQAYHLRRLTRHQRWLTGPGTVFGLAIDVSEVAKSGGGTDVVLTVNPGYAIDGLGREVVVSEAYALSLSDWLAAENAGEDVAESYDTVGKMLYLRVTVRAQACPTALQPVVAELFDSGLDPVVTARIADSFLLELSGDPARTGDTLARPLDTWSPDRTTPAATDLPDTTIARETATLASLSGATLAAAQLQAWLLRRPFPQFDDSPGGELQQTETARLLLASVHISLDTVTTAPTLAGTALNNLVRPFVRPNVLLAALTLP